MPLPDDSPKGPWKGCVFANADYLGIIRKIDLPNCNYLSLRNGGNFTAGYQYTPFDKFGIGIRYSLHFNSTKAGIDTKTARDNIPLHYICPKIVIR